MCPLPSYRTREQRRGGAGGKWKLINHLTEVRKCAALGEFVDLLRILAGKKKSQNIKLYSLIFLMRRANLYVAKPRVALGPSWPWDVSSHFCFSSCFKTFIWPAGAPTSAKGRRSMFGFPCLSLVGRTFMIKGEVGGGPHATLRLHHTISVTPREDCWGGVNRIPGSVDD